MSVDSPLTLPWVENVPTRSRLANLRLGDVWRHRELALFFAVRDVKVRYKQALLGVVWAFLQPLVGAAAFTLVFNNLADIDVEGRSYFAFALTGYVVWGYFSTVLFSGMNSLLGNANLLSKVSFPRILLPLATTLPPVIDLAIGCVLALAAALLAGDGFSPAGFVVGLPLGLTLLVVAVVGPMLVLSGLLARYRDIGAVAGYGMQFVMFASPVAYPPDLVPDSWQGVYYANPVAGALGLMRAALVNADLPSAVHLAQSFGVAAMLFVGGVIWFQSSSRDIADVI